MNKSPHAAYIAAWGDFMYEVYLGAEQIGTAQVEKQGLTYCIRCRCRLSGEVAYKVMVQCGEREVDLGILVPENGAFQLKSRVNVKQLGTGELSFHAVPRHVATDGMFVPVSADEPFKYLSRLQNAFMSRSEGHQGVYLSNHRTE